MIRYHGIHDRSIEGLISTVFRRILFRNRDWRSVDGVQTAFGLWNLLVVERRCGTEGWRPRK